MTSKVCMIGTGYVGLVTGAGLAALGHKVCCVDVNLLKIENLQQGTIPFYEKGVDELVVSGLTTGNLSFTTNLSDALKDCRYVFIAVQTPPGLNNEPDLSFVYEVLDSLIDLVSQQVLLIIKSTVPVGCFRDFKNHLNRSKKAELFELVSCPEFLAEGTAVEDFFNPSRTIVGASSEELAREVAHLFDGVTGPRVYTTPETAQLIKYASNSFLASRIAFVNDISRVCELLNVDVRDVSKGVMLDKRFGEGYFNASVGYGGSCLPKDLAALTYTAISLGYVSSVWNAIAIQNETQIRHSVELISSKLKEGDKIAVFGLSFKAGTSDVRFSPSVSIIKQLLEGGFVVCATDPESVSDAKEVLDGYPVTFSSNPWVVADSSEMQVFLTAWPQYKHIDLTRLKAVVNKPCIFDGPGIFNALEVEDLGFSYFGIGRNQAYSRLVIEE